jgi:RNA polymerase sigma-70 factor, ECF subfamily
LALEERCRWWRGIENFPTFVGMTVINGIKEETLIQRLINGDQTAFELLFRFYYPGLVTFASHIVLDSDEAEEIVQDFFVKFWAGRREIKKSDTLKSYFFTSVKNRALNVLKKEKISERCGQNFGKWLKQTGFTNPTFLLNRSCNHASNQLLKNYRPVPMKFLL